MYAKLPPLWKLRGLILCSSLTVLFSQGCAVDISHLQAPSDAAAGHEDTKLDGALADAATLNRDAVPQDTNRSPDYSAREDTSPDGARMPDLLPSATDGRADSREDSQTVPDRAPSSDTKTFVDVAAPEVPGTTDAADATVASPDLAIPADAPQKLDSVPDVPPTVVKEPPRYTVLPSPLTAIVFTEALALGFHEVAAPVAVVMAAALFLL